MSAMLATQYPHVREPLYLTRDVERRTLYVMKQAFAVFGVSVGIGAAFYAVFIYVNLPIRPEVAGTAIQASRPHATPAAYVPLFADPKLLDPARAEIARRIDSGEYQNLFPRSHGGADTAKSLSDAWIAFASLPREQRTKIITAWSSLEIPWASERPPGRDIASWSSERNGAFSEDSLRAWVAKYHDVVRGTCYGPAAAIPGPLNVQLVVQYVERRRQHLGRSPGPDWVAVKKVESVRGPRRTGTAADLPLPAVSGEAYEAMGRLADMPDDPVCALSYATFQPGGSITKPGDYLEVTYVFNE